MTEAIGWFERRGLPIERVSPLQLKFGELNYYPHSGGMNFDQLPRMEERGLEALGRVVDEIASQTAQVSEIKIRFS